MKTAILTAVAAGALLLATPITPAQAHDTHVNSNLALPCIDIVSPLGDCPVPQASAKGKVHFDPSGPSAGPFGTLVARKCHSEVRGKGVVFLANPSGVGNRRFIFCG